MKARYSIQDNILYYIPSAIRHRIFDDSLVVTEMLTKLGKRVNLLYYAASWRRSRIWPSHIHTIHLHFHYSWLHQLSFHYIPCLVLVLAWFFLYSTYAGTQSVSGFYVHMYVRMYTTTYYGSSNGHKHYPPTVFSSHAPDRRRGRLTGNPWNSWEMDTGGPAGLVRFYGYGCYDDDDADDADAHG